MYSIMSSVNSENFTYFFTFIPFPYFSCLIVVARTSNTMLNRSDENEHPCLAPGFSRKAFSVSPFSIMLAVDLP